MPQALTEDLLDILASRFQAAATGYRARIEVDYIIPAAPPGVTPSIVQEKSVTSMTNPTLSFDSNVTVGNVIVAALIGWEDAPAPSMFDGSWTHLGSATGIAHASYGAQPFRTAIRFWAKVATSTSPTVAREATSADMWMYAWELVDADLDDVTVLEADRQADSPMSLGTFTSASGVALMACGVTRATDQANNGFACTPGTGWTELKDQSINPGAFGGFEPWIYYASAAPSGANLDATATVVPTAGGQSVGEWGGVAVLFGTTGGSSVIGELGTQNIIPERIAIDKSRRMAASSALVEIPNELGELDLSPTGHIKSHHPIRIYQWYGDLLNEVQTFTGFVDAVRESRDKRTVILTCRDTMKRLIVQTFSATDPQGAGEDGAVRTEANGVFLEQDADYIVDAILDQAGWPSADRDIAPTGYALDEYIIADGTSWAEAIIGPNALTGLTGYEAWADELGVFHFRPMLASAAPDTDTEPIPDYTYEISTGAVGNLTSRQVLRLDHDIDDYETKTRVKVRGNLATAVAAFTEVWHTNKFNKPVGLWWDPTDPDYLRVLDRGTKKIYRLRQSDREKVGAGIWPLDISGDVNHPLGLSGDPADSDVFWVLDAAWRTTAGNSASIHKYDASSGAHLAEYSLPDGQWSDLKVSSSFIWVTNYGTDKLHKRSKSDGTNITTYDGPTVNGNVQTNPTGVAIDATTLLTFWDGKARFLLTDESSPETLDPSTPLLDGNGIIRTAGSKIFGGEMDTVTDAHLFACSDDLGIVWKYALTEPSTDEVYAQAIDAELEDELGFLSGAEPRDHDAEPDELELPPHSYEIRRETVTLEKTITNLAQAVETAHRILDELAHRRETVDFGVVGHPGIQRGDLHLLVDPLTGIDALYVVDTYRDNMDERGYLATVAYVPYDPAY